MNEKDEFISDADTPGKLDPRSQDIGKEKREELLRLFPELRTEGGKIDFDLLKLALGETVDVGKERYGMTWPGKAECFRTIQAPSLGTLLPCPEESVAFDMTQNLIIEGDNLEVLKLLQKSYLGKIKMIYIDPPYNTGSDFIYPDNYTESLQTYLEYTGQVDAEGRKFGTNAETDGRFHSKWMNMMYPRLYLARNLLLEDGAICVSIDDSELSNLRSVRNEIFGEENFISVIVVQANKRGQTYKEIAKTHEYLLVYSREPDLSLNELDKTDGSLPFSDSLGPFDLWELRNRNPKFGRRNRPNLFFPIYVAPGQLDESGYAKVALDRSSTYSVEVFPLDSEGGEGCWRWSTDLIHSKELAGKCPEVVAKQRRDGAWNIYQKSRKSTTKAKSLWTDSGVISEQGTIELGALEMGNAFDHPKPLELLRKCMRICSDATSQDIILDFFGGSGTAAHAVLELNKEENGNRRFVLVQLPEPLDPSNSDQRNAVEFCDSIGRPRNIAEITKERVRRAIKKLTDDETGRLKLGEGATQDRGFRVFKLAESNFTSWNAESSRDAEMLGKQLELHVNHIREGRKPTDLLYEILVKGGFPLTTPVETLSLAGKKVRSVAGGVLLICLERELTLDLIRAMAERKPERVVCLDEGFSGKDQLKANAVQIFKGKGVTSFKTV